MLERILSSTYSAFDKDPNAQIAFRVRHADGVAWQVRDRVLTASTELGAPLAVIALREKTMDEVVELLAAAGCEVVYQSPAYASRAADSLLDGSGRQSQSDGDAFRVYDSLLWAMLDAYAVALEDGSADIEAAIRQLYLGTAEAEWLEVWGDYFGIPRAANETDEAYRVRIIVETLRPRVTKLAIERAIKSVTGNTVEMYEPWRDLFILGVSELDGSHHMEDGRYWTHNVAQPVSSLSIDWKPVMDVIERSRPAGTIIAPPRLVPRLSVSSSMTTTGSALAGQTDTRSMSAFVESKGRLDFFALGDEAPGAINHKGSMGQLIALRNLDALATPGSIDATRRNMRRANIVLSDSDEIGAINSIFPRTYWIQPPDFMTLSSHTALSDYDGAIELGMVNEITTLYAGGVSFSDMGGAVASFGIWENRPIGAVPAESETEQAPVGIEAVKSGVSTFSGTLNPKPAMWGFHGGGAWAQDEETGWEESTPWGTGVRQS